MNFLVWNMPEWLAFGWFSKEQLESVDDSGYIGKKNGVDCYLARGIGYYINK